LVPLHEAPETALDLAGKMGRQRREAPTQLNFRPLPRREGNLRRFSRSDIIWGQIRMASIRILLNVDESSVLGCLVFS
jgi:hypothetical protein